jgi:hypothetical protein
MEEFSTILQRHATRLATLGSQASAAAPVAPAGAGSGGA